MNNSCKSSSTKMVYTIMAAMVVVLVSSCGSKSKYAGPLSPEASMKTFQFAENFSADIFATEPLVIDPVDSEYDEEGNA